MFSSFPAGRTLLIQANISLGSSQLQPGDISVNMGVSTASLFFPLKHLLPSFPKHSVLNSYYGCIPPVNSFFPTETLEQNQSQRIREVHRAYLQRRVCPSLSLLLSPCPYPGLSSLRGLTQLENPEAWVRSRAEVAAISALNRKQIPSSEAAGMSPLSGEGTVCHVQCLTVLTHTLPWNFG